MKNILYYYHDSCGIGDFYLLFPLFDALRSKYKDDNITLLSTNSIKSIAYNKKWFDNYINIFESEYPINRFDRVYNWDVQKHGITLFYPPKKHFWEIVSDNLSAANVRAGAVLRLSGSRITARADFDSVSI